MPWMYNRHANTQNTYNQAAQSHNVPPPRDLLADGVAHHLVEVGDAVPRQVVELAPQELPEEGDGRLRVLALELGVHLFV